MPGLPFETPAPRRSGCTPTPADGHERSGRHPWSVSSQVAGTPSFTAALHSSSRAPRPLPTRLPWQAGEALLRQVRAATLTSNSTLVVVSFSLELLVFYDLLHLPVNSKWFPDGSGLYPPSQQQRSSFSPRTSGRGKSRGPTQRHVCADYENGTRSRSWTRALAERHGPGKGFCKVLTGEAGTPG